MGSSTSSIHFQALIKSIECPLKLNPFPLPLPFKVQYPRGTILRTNRSYCWAENPNVSAASRNLASKIPTFKLNNFALLLIPYFVAILLPNYFVFAAVAIVCCWSPCCRRADPWGNVINGLCSGSRMGKMTLGLRGAQQVAPNTTRGVPTAQCAHRHQS